MIQICRSDKGFTVTASEADMGWDPITAEAKDAEEAALAVQHYYGSTSHVKPDPRCPFCRDS